MKQAITYFEIAAFVASVVALPYIKKVNHLRLFPLLLFVVVIVEIQQAFFQQPGYNNSAIYNLQVPLQHVLYLFILHQSFSSPLYRKILGMELVALIIFTVISGTFFTEPGRFNILAYCFGSVLIIVGIVIRFYEMLQNPMDFNFLKDPFFHMLFVFLVFNVATLPYFTMSNWLHFVDSKTKIVQILVNVMSIFNYILYSTYTLAFLWMIHKARSFSSPPR